MLRIPTSLVLSPESALKSETIGHVFADERSFKGIGGDGKFHVTVFLMHERLKGEASFWFPYIQTLPYPRTVLDWTEAELAELQHQSFVDELPDHRALMKEQYETVLTRLQTLFPKEFPAEKYTFQLFQWAYLTVQVGRHAQT